MIFLDWWRERRRAKLMKDICKLIGHDWYYPFGRPEEIWVPRRRDCIRCFGIVQVAHGWTSDKGYEWR